MTTNIKWDDTTAAALSVPDLPDWVEAKLINGLRARAKAKELEAEVKALKEQGNLLLALCMDFASLKKVTAKGIGQVIRKNGANVSYPKDKISDELLARGVEATIIGGAIEAAKTVKTYTSYEFKW